MRVPSARRELLGGPLRHHPPASGTAFRSEIYYPVGLGDDVEVVLDHDDRVARVYEPMQDADQALDVGHVQTDGGLIEHVERSTRRPQPGKLGYELDALRLAARQGRALLTQRQVAETYVLQQPERVMDARVSGEKGSA